jgi:hypothetical protein
VVVERDDAPKDDVFIVIDSIVDPSIEDADILDM